MDTDKGWLVLIVKTNWGWIHQSRCSEAYTYNLKTSNLSHHRVYNCKWFNTCTHTQYMYIVSLHRKLRPQLC